MALWFCWRSLSLFRLKTRLKKSHRLRNKSLRAWTELAKATLSVLSPVFDEAVKLAPEMAQACHQRGKADSILDQREQAIQDFNEAIRLDPQNAQASFSRGVSLDVLSEYQRAK